jgi:hypothetical protein
MMPAISATTDMITYRIANARNTGYLPPLDT